MDDESRISSDSDLQSQIDILSKDRTRVPHRDFENLLKKGGGSSVPVSDLRRALSFACDQLGTWQTDWLFSPAHSPNEIAKTEMEGWRILWQAFFNTIVQVVPDTRDLLEKEKDIKLAHCSLRRRLEYNAANPLRKIGASMLSHASFVFDKIGLHCTARNLYTRGLYPKGTVARP